MHQSPKSKRPKAPGEKPSSDGLQETRSGGTSGSASNSPRGSGKPTVPSMPRNDSGGYQGGVQSGSQTVGTQASQPPSSGGPGGVSLKDSDAMRKGGTTERFSSNRGGNS